jgi:hypothetical protein
MQDEQPPGAKLDDLVFDCLILTSPKTLLFIVFSLLVPSDYVVGGQCSSC